MFWKAHKTKNTLSTSWSKNGGFFALLRVVVGKVVYVHLRNESERTYKNGIRISRWWTDRNANTDWPVFGLLLLLLAEFCSCWERVVVLLLLLKLKAASLCIEGEQKLTETQRCRIVYTCIYRKRFRPILTYRASVYEFLTYFFQKKMPSLQIHLMIHINILVLKKTTTDSILSSKKHSI